MKRFVTILMLITLALAVSCKKDSAGPVPGNRETLTAHIGGPDSKVEFNAGTGQFSWSDPDHIALHLSSGAYTTVEVSAAGVFTIVPDAGVSRDGYAIYPVDAAAGTAAAPVITLPASYDLEDASGMGNWYPTPMIAVNTPQSSDLWFYHVGGALRLTLKNVPAGTKALLVNMGKGISGNFPVSDPDTATPTIAPGASAADGVRFELPDNLEEDTDGIVLNIPLPAGTYPRLSVTAVDVVSDGDMELLSASVYKDWTFPRSRARQLTLDMVTSVVGSNLFSVSPVKQVSFSPGNLQNINGAWKFADEQYERLLAYDPDAWDLFSFSTDNPGNNFGMNTFIVDPDSPEPELGYFKGHFVDWGDAVTAQGDLGTGWRTLASREWEYLLGKFDWLTDGFTGKDDVLVGPVIGYGRNNGNPHALRGYAIIYTETEAIPGMVILPDDWTCPAGCRPLVGGRWERSDEAYYDNTYNAGGSAGTSGEWAMMEASGAVFLPAAGCRQGESMILTGGLTGSQYNGYRSSDHNEDNPSVSYAMAFAPGDDDNYGINAQSWFGLSVRLVKDEAVGSLENLIGELGEAGKYEHGTLF